MANVQMDLFGNVVGAEPFLQWMGGKRRLWSQMRPYFPETFGTYYEPFLGGGAVFLNLQPERAVLGDASSSLVNAWRWVKDSPCELLNELYTLQDGRAEYAAAKLEFNSTVGDTLRRAALFIYLTHVCFNGMFRMNKSGKMNSPYGGGWCIPEAATFNAQQALRNAELRSGDYEGVLLDAKDGDFVYLDPPYDDSDTPYLPGGWSTDDTRRLGVVASSLVERGCYIIVSNHNTSLVRDVFAGFRLVVIERPGNFNGHADGRAPVEEVLIIGGGHR